VKIESNDSTINLGKTGLKIQDVIGASVSKIGAYKKLDNKKQVVALIDDVSGLFFLKFKRNLQKSISFLH
jgi:hypothetical protein